MNNYFLRSPHQQMKRQSHLLAYFPKKCKLSLVEEENAEPVEELEPETKLNPKKKTQKN